MTIAELELANTLKEQMHQLENIVECLQKSVENHEKNTKEQQYKRFFRFVNYKRRFEDTERAGVFLFNGLSVHGIEIPVDQETCEKVMEIFKARLEETRKDFAEIGSDGNQRKGKEDAENG